MGALLQTVALAVLPARYALLPVALLVGRAVITTILQVRAPQTNPFLYNIIPGRTTAQLPLPSPSEENKTSAPSSLLSTRRFGTQAASQPLVVFHLGARINHPLGPLAPGARELGAHFQAMVAALQARRAEYGLLSVSQWRGQDRATSNVVMMIAYFRSVADLNRFAHDGVHRAGWDWYHGFVRATGHRHLGLFHETFVSGRGDYETIYVDTAPTLLGGANVQVQGQGEGEAEGEGERETAWLRPLVSADHPALRSQAKRMGLTLGLKEAGGEESR